MHKKHLHHLWTRVRPIKTSYLFAAFLVCGAVAVWALRSNYIAMTQLREAVYQADREQGDVAGALQKLRSHVNSHMNTRLSGGPEAVYPPIQLKETYQRLVDAEQSRFQAENVALYTQAQLHCERQNPDSFSGGSRVPCIEQYVKQKGKTPRQIPDALYKFDFASPRWAPDLAGWSLAAAGLLLIATLLRFAVGRLAKRL